MDKRALVLVPIALLLMSAKGCQTLEGRAENAAAMKGQAMAKAPPLTLPEACTTHMQRVKLRDEPWVIFRQRWEVAADNRDRQADDCKAFEDDYNLRLGAKQEVRDW